MRTLLTLVLSLALCSCSTVTPFVKDVQVVPPKEDKGAVRLRVMICDLRRYYLFPFAINVDVEDSSCRLKYLPLDGSKYRDE
jgi:hypothetical protein